MHHSKLNTNRHHTYFILLCCILLPFLFSTQPTQAQNQNLTLKSNGSSFTAPDTSQPIKVGLVLSGGGAKGFAHIGALKVIREAGVRVDYITGTSMGSIIGGLHAIGYSPEYLENLVIETDWQQLFTERPERSDLSMQEKMVDGQYVVSLPLNRERIQLPVGLITGQNVFAKLARLTWPVHNVSDFSNLPIPFACVAADLETGEAVVLDEGYLPDAMRASMSIPSIFTPYRLDGRTLIDGGVVRNLPAQDALNMGANYLLGVDVSTRIKPADSLNTFLDVLNQVLSFQMTQSTDEQRALVDQLIKPSIQNYGLDDFDKAEELINHGEEAARRHMEELKALAKLQDDAPSYEYRPPDIDELYIYDIEIQGLEQIPEELILKEIQLRAGTWVTPEEVERIVTRLYGTQLFELVTHRLMVDERGTRLILRVTERESNTFRFGFRYDTDTQASLIFNANYRNVLKPGAMLRIHTLLGDAAHARGEYLFFFGGMKQNLALRSLLEYQRTYIPWYEGGEQSSSFVSSAYRSDLMLGTLFSNNFVIGAGLRKEIVDLNNFVNRQYIFEEQHFHMFQGLFWLDNFNSTSFATQGHSVHATFNYTGDVIFSPQEFGQQTFLWKTAVPLHESISWKSQLYIGRSTGPDLPPHYYYFMRELDPWMGRISFPGYQRRELAGRNVQSVVGGLQFEPFNRKYLEIYGGLGNTFSNFEIDPSQNKYLSGLGIRIGAETIIGPVELSASTSSRNNVQIRFQMGYGF